MNLTLDSKIEEVPGIGNILAKKLLKLKIKTIKDLLFYFPFRYEDFSKISPIANLKINEQGTILGKIVDLKKEVTKNKRINIVRALIKDESSAIEALWFGQPYIANLLKRGDEVLFAGKLILSKNKLYLPNPIFEKIEEGKDLTHLGRIIPIYEQTKGISSKFIRALIKKTLLLLGNNIPEILPQEIIKENNFLSRKEAFWQIHFPDSLELVKKAKERFSLEELFLLELAVLSERIRLQKEIAPIIPIKIDIIKDFVNSLPFKLTNAQRKAAFQILKDLEKGKPASRLLQGDVGSGKTVVATIAILNTIKQDWQCALMAPTEILAKQHFKEISNLLSKYKFKIALLTSKEDKIMATKLKGETIEISRKKLLEKTENGEIDLLIGTHSLIQKNVKFKKLGLVIIDEQHRFGVEQRAKLCKKTREEKSLLPHFLSLTATPIPRTLALTLYGDLDISILDEMPKGRKKIITQVIKPSEIKKLYDFIREEVKKGHQIFVICPRIQPKNNSNENSKIDLWKDVKAVEEEYEKLSKKIFPDLKVAKLHGKMKPKEKEKIMQNFKKGKIDILVSTSVIEVGINIPNATVMVIEGAERFGVAQIYQMRGRVGRSDLQSYCFLVANSESKKVIQRLKAILEAKDSFELSKKDLIIRGPGSLMGKKQWGIPDFLMKSLENIQLVEMTRNLAKKILLEDPALSKYPLLKNSLLSTKEKIHLE
ncbi:MAG: ATP-dependent DNA helicase RecG [Minisyncoccia bacterium]